MFKIFLQYLVDMPVTLARFMVMLIASPAVAGMMTYGAIITGSSAEQAKNAGFLGYIAMMMLTFGLVLIDMMRDSFRRWRHNRAVRRAQALEWGVTVNYGP